MVEHVYMAVTTDKLELPLAIADTAIELGNILGIKSETIYSSISKQRSGKNNGFKLLKVLIEVEE